MTSERASADRVVDQVWSRALEKILRDARPTVLRSLLGDDLDLNVPQRIMASLLNANSAFGRVLYTSAYASAKRNGYFVMRRLGMPTDFFWQFDQWSQDRACSTLQKVIGRIFAAIMTRQREGVLEVVAVDQQSGMIQVSFESCAECHGLNASKPMCFYHAGLFAGLLSSMLDRDLDAFETDCGGVQGKVCTFTIGGSDGALVSRSLGEWLASGAGRIGQPAGSETDSPGQGRGLGSLVDIGYYQMLIASSLLANADLVQRACFDAGVEVGDAIAPEVAARYGTETGAALAGYYQDTRYIDLNLNRVEDGIILEAREVPEAVGPLSTTSLTAFLCGELQALVGRLEGRELRYGGSEMKGGTLLVRLVPKLLEA